MEVQRLKQRGWRSTQYGQTQFLIKLNVIKIKAFSLQSLPLLHPHKPPRFQQQVPTTSATGAADARSKAGERRRRRRQSSPEVSPARTNLPKWPPFSFLLPEETGQVLEPRRRTPRRSSLAFANLDRCDLDCRHGAIAVCREHYQRCQLPPSSPLPLLASTWLT